MCGIIGYKGKQQALSVMRRLMHCLDYRGYDSHGVCFTVGDDFYIHKALGPTNLEGIDVDSHCGIGHVRWATNGEVSIENAHPHIADNLALVHNGIVRDLKSISLSGSQCLGTTDTEVLAHWLSQASSYKDALANVGDYAVIFLVKGKNTLYVASNGIPLYVARVDGDYYIASSVNVFQETFDSYEYADIEGQYLEFGEPNLQWKKATGTPKVVLPVGESYNGIVTLSEIKEKCYCPEETLSLDSNKKLIMFGCGSSYNAALISRYFFRDVGYETEVFIPSELRHLPHFRAQYLAISQSGETKDVLDMGKYLKSGGMPFDAIVNSESSSLERMANNTLHLRCGAEMGVAATKTFSATLWSLLATAQPLRAKQTALMLKKAYPLIFGPFYPTIPAYLRAFNSVFLFGGGITHYVNLEGALKMKEMAGVHAEAVPAAEVKHGPIVLINDQTLSIFVLINDTYDEQIMENISQVACRGSKVLVLTNNDRDYKGEVIHMPDQGDNFTNSFIATIYLQLIAWELGSLRGANIDRPLNLAKCVTV